MNDIFDAIAAIPTPEDAYGGSDEWDLNDAYRNGWLAALDAVDRAINAAVNADEPVSHEAGDHAPLPDPDCDRCNDSSN